MGSSGTELPPRSMKVICPPHCEYHLTYTALKQWDVAMYMHHAELRLYNGHDQIAYAEYHLNGGGGLALNKWASVDSKMDPVIDRLLSDYSPETVDAFREAIPKDPAIASEAVIETANSDTAERLRSLKEWYEEGLITQEEYDVKRQKVLAE